MEVSGNGNSISRHINNKCIYFGNVKTKNQGQSNIKARCKTVTEYRHMDRDEQILNCFRE